jgi:hypothetical protein
MDMVRLITLFSLLLLANVAGWLINTPAHARCCACNMACGGGCGFCPGVGGCPYCAAPDVSVTSEANPAVSGETDATGADVGSVPSLILTSPNMDRLIRLAGARQCDRINHRLKFLESDESVLRFDQGFSQTLAAMNNLVTLR